MKSLYASGLLLTSPLILIGQTAWIDGGFDSTWSTSSNWSNGVPNSSSSVIIQTQPTDDLIGIDTGVTVIGSLTFASSLSSPTAILAFGNDTLQVNGAITNLDSSLHTLGLPVFAGANATWAGGSGGLAYTAGVNLGTRSITLTGNHSINGPLVFEITSPTVFGRFLGNGSLTTSGAAITIQVAPTYLATANVGDSFTFFSSGFTGASFNTTAFLNNNPLPSGLSWNTSQFISQGVIQVIPEPASIAGLAGLAAVGFVATRRRRRVTA